VNEPALVDDHPAALDDRPDRRHAHSHEVDHHHSLTAIISIFGSTFTTVL